MGAYNDAGMRAQPAGGAAAPVPRSLACVPSILTLAVPISAGLATSALMGVVDSVVVAPLGNAAMGAVSLANSVMLMFIAALYGLLSPIGILAARAFGAGDAAGVAAQRRAGWRLALGAGLGAAALMIAGLPVLPHLGQPREVLDVLAPYWVCCALALVPLAALLVEKQALDAIERPWWSVGVNLAATLVNALVSLWLVGGGAGVPALGLLGAGVGTIAAYAVAVAACLALGRAMPALRRWLHDDTRRDWKAEFRVQRAEGVPMGLQYLLETGATAVAGVLVGLFGAVALAANQIAMSVAMLVYMVPLGVAAAAGIRLAQAVGAGDTAALWPLGKAALVVVSGWTVAASAGMALGGGWLAGGFTDERAVIAAAVSMFVALSLMQVADGIQSVSLGALRGLLDSRWPTQVSLWCYWAVALPAAWLVARPFGWGAAGVWVGFGIGLAVAAVALTVRLKRCTAAYGRG